MSALKTHADLVEVARRWLAGTRHCALVATERSCWKSSESPDAIGWAPDGRSVLVECKVSRADLWADQRKKHRRAGPGMGLERWYLADRGVLKPEWIPAGWGLLELKNGRVYRIVHAAVRSDLAGEIARLEQPLLVALTRRAMVGGRSGLFTPESQIEEQNHAGANAGTADHPERPNGAQDALG